MKLYVKNCNTCGKRLYYTQAGRFAGKARCYAIAVIADNAIFSFAVNRISAFRAQSENYYRIISCRGSVGRASPTIT